MEIVLLGNLETKKFPKVIPNGQVWRHSPLIPAPGRHTGLCEFAMRLFLQNEFQDVQGYIDLPLTQKVIQEYIRSSVFASSKTAFP